MSEIPYDEKGNVNCCQCGQPIFGVGFSHRYTLQEGKFYCEICLPPEAEPDENQRIFTHHKPEVKEFGDELDG